MLWDKMWAKYEDGISELSFEQWIEIAHRCLDYSVDYLAHKSSEIEIDASALKSVLQFRASVSSTGQLPKKEEKKRQTLIEKFEDDDVNADSPGILDMLMAFDFFDLEQDDASIDDLADCLSYCYQVIYFIEIVEPNHCWCDANCQKGFDTMIKFKRNRDEARLPAKVVNKIQKIRDEASEAMENGDFDSGIALFENAWDMVPEPKLNWDYSVRLLESLCTACIDAGKYRAAKKWHKLMLKTPFTDIDSSPYELGGIIYYHLGDLDLSYEFLLLNLEVGGKKVLKLLEPELRDFFTSRYETR